MTLLLVRLAATAPRTQRNNERSCEVADLLQFATKGRFPSLPRQPRSVSVLSATVSPTPPWPRIVLAAKSCVNRTRRGPVHFLGRLREHYLAFTRRCDSPTKVGSGRE